MPLGGGNDKQGTRRGDEGSRGWLIGDAAGKGFGGLYSSVGTISAGTNSPVHRTMQSYGVVNVDVVARLKLAV